MSRSRLIPESQLVFSAELAAAVGLEEAVLLQQIRGLYLHQPCTRRDGLAWLHVSEAYLLQLVPFWSAADLRRLCRSLDALGLVRTDPDSAAPECLLLAINDHEAPLAPAEPTSTAGAQRPQAAQVPRNTSGNLPEAADDKGKLRGGLRRGEGEPLPRDFMPSEDMLEILEQFHGVPRAFALQQLEDFTLYWRERGSAGHAWQNKYKQHVQFQWARHHQEHSGGDNAEIRGSGGARRTRDSSLEHDLTDTSWAD